MATTERKTHPSYGVLNIGRFTGKSRFFQSDIQHHGGIYLEIGEAYTTNQYHVDSLGHDRGLIRVEMSAEQFARAITSMNQLGTPVTLRYFNGVAIAQEKPTPYRETFDAAAQAVFDTAVESCRSVEKQIAELIANGKAGKKELQELASAARQATQRLQADTPFLVKVFREKMDHVETAAKAEIAAAIDAGFQRLGAAKLADRMAGSVAALLGKDSDA